MSTDLNIARFELNIARNDLNEMNISKANTSCELKDALDENRKLLVQLKKEKEQSCYRETRSESERSQQILHLYLH